MNVGFLDLKSQAKSKDGGTRGTGGTSNIYAVFSVPPTIPAWENKGNRTETLRATTDCRLKNVPPCSPCVPPSRKQNQPMFMRLFPSFPLFPLKREVLRQVESRPEAPDTWREGFVRRARDQRAFRDRCDNSASIGFLLGGLGGMVRRAGWGP